MVLDGLAKLKSSILSVRTGDFLKKVGGNGLPDANTLCRGGVDAAAWLRPPAR